MIRKPQAGFSLVEVSVAVGILALGLVAVVALLVPVERTENAAGDDTWASLDILAAEIGARWPRDLSSVEAVAEGRG